MTTAPHIGLKQSSSSKPGSLVLGDDWVSSDAIDEVAANGGNTRRGLFLLNRSPLARKIIIFNLMALVVLVAGVLFMNPFRDSLVLQREQGLVTESRLIAQVIEASIAAQGGQGDAALLQKSVDEVAIGRGVEVYLYNLAGVQMAKSLGSLDTDALLPQGSRSTIITGFLDTVWDSVSGFIDFSPSKVVVESGEPLALSLLPKALQGESSASSGRGLGGGSYFGVGTPISQAGKVIGAVVLTSAQGEIDQLVRYEREQVLQMFIIALLVSIGLSLVLASTIANPLSDLAAAAELGRDRDARKMSPGRIRIPDLAARPDEIGRLSIAMRGMVAALYDRIDANEQFAADVSHEIKNPLASLNSAVGSLRMVKKEEHREKLLDVIEHDVRRLDRLVSDISNASRLDSELVKEEEEEFNLLKTLQNLCRYLSEQAGKKDVEFITDFPAESIKVHGLEARLAQVFVNLITNAISFCEDGDAVRVWARQRENRVLIVVEDTGPGIPEQALGKVFKRFYSERPVSDFGNHSGLGLSISKQIVEAHGGVIWAENIRPTNADPTSEPLGARFVVGLPI